jgi:hypothetical protein
LNEDPAAWENILTWTAQRDYEVHVVREVEMQGASAGFMASLVARAFSLRATLRDRDYITGNMPIDMVPS